MAHTFLFEVKGIQRYVFDSGPLRDVVGASDLVAGLVKSPVSTSGMGAGASDHDLIGQVINAARPAQGGLDFSRRASGAFCLHSDDKAALDEIRALWRLAVQLRCPGLEMTEGISEAGGMATWKESRDSARASVPGIRENGGAALPPAGGPVTQFVARTGRPVTAVALYDEEVSFDAVTAPQRVHAGSLKRDGITSRFLSEDLRDAQPPYVFPRNIDRRVKEDEDNPLFPFRGEDTRLAVIHADISGLGQTYSDASRAASTPEQMRALSKAIERAIEGAAQAATQQILIPATRERQIGSSRLMLVPARPILMGGDDITIIVRADLALPFTAVLLTEIEKRTEIELEPYHAPLAVPEFLSACAGIAIVGRGQPFLMAHEIAEGLCGMAKRKAKKAKEPRGPFPSGVAFHLAGSSMQEHYDDIFKNEMTATAAGRKLTLTANPYWLGRLADDMGKTSWRGLRRLAWEIRKVDAGRGVLRQLRADAFEDLGTFNARWKRWCEVARRESAGVRNALEEMGVAFETGDEAQALFDAANCTPLFDALDLIDIGTDLSGGAAEENR